MSHLYGTIDLTVAGPQSEIQKVAGMIREVEYTQEHEAGLLLRVGLPILTIRNVMSRWTCGVCITRATRISIRSMTTMMLLK